MEKVSILDDETKETEKLLSKDFGTKELATVSTIDHKRFLKPYLAKTTPPSSFG